MKKRYGALTAFVLATGAAAAVNRLIFNRCEAALKNGKIKTPAYKNLTNRHVYKWRYGNVNYVVYGSGEPVLLVHDADIGGSLADWAKLIPLLARQYTVYAVDLPGYGLSDKPKLTYSSYLYASFVNDFVADCVGESVCAVADGLAAGFVAAGCKFMPGLYSKILLLPNNDNKKTSFILSRFFGRFLTIPVYGTLAYNIITSKAAIGAQKYILSHIGGAGNKYAVSAFIRKFFYIDTDRIINKIIIPVRVIKNGPRKKYSSDPRAFYRLIKNFFDS